MREIVWSATARQDINELVAFYQEFGSDVVDRLIDRIEGAAVKLLDFPNLEPALPDSERRTWPAKHTPYILIYQPIGSAIHILRVEHGHKDWRPPG